MNQNSTGPPDQADDRTVLVAGGLFYNSIDPYAVCIVFRVYDDTLDWIFARSLLIGGFHVPVGYGDNDPDSYAADRTAPFAEELRAMTGSRL